MRVFAALVLLVAVLAGLRTSSPSAAATPRAQMLFGMNVPSLAALDQSEAAVGARAALVGTFADWAHTQAFPADWAAAVNRRGAVPLISWEPWDSWTGGADQPAARSHASSPATTTR